jgi:hypothetical protein
MTYSSAFYSRTSQTAEASARKIVPRLARAIRPASVLDVGTGGGAWVHVWAGYGVSDLTGIDAASPEESGYAMPLASYKQIDLKDEFDLGKRFSLVQCLEVAEHLPPRTAPGLIASLCRHSDLIVFSAAPPGQGGTYHRNEQEFSYWRQLFAQRGYRPIDWLRSQLANEPDVAWWYRYNLLLYANDAGMALLPDDILAARLADHAPIPDIAPPRHRMRRMILRQLPWQVVTWIAAAGDRLGRRAAG